MSIDVDVDVEVDRSEMSLVACRRDMEKGSRRSTMIF